MPPSSQSSARRLVRTQKKGAENASDTKSQTRPDPYQASAGFRESFAKMVEDAKYAVLKDARLEEPERPEEEFPTLPVELAEVNDHELISLLVRFTRWANYFAVLVAYDEVQEKFAEDKVSKLEDLFMLSNRPEKPQAGELSMIKASMEGDKEISACREAYRVVYAHRKLMQTFFESAERSTFAVSRELTRRGGGMDTYERRVSRLKP